MKLYYSEASPYARKVRVLLCELELLDSCELIPTNPLEQSELLANANPLVKVPCLVVGEQSLFDSDVICDYLLTETDNPFHLAIDTKDWSSKVLYACANGLLDVAVDRRKELALRSDTSPSEYWLARYQQAINHSLSFLEQQLHKEQLLHMNIAHLTVAVALEYLDFRHSDIAWKTSHPLLANWLFTVNKRRSLLTTRPS